MEEEDLGKGTKFAASNDEDGEVGASAGSQGRKKNFGLEEIGSQVADIDAVSFFSPVCRAIYLKNIKKQEGETSIQRHKYHSIVYYAITFIIFLS